MVKNNKPLWEPSPQQVKDANMTAFITQINQKHDTDIITFEKLHHWSIDNPRDFWREVWDFCGLSSSHVGDREIGITDGMFLTQFFGDAKLNYAENLLSPRPFNSPMLIFWGEDKVKRTLTYQEVYQKVTQLAAYLRSIGVRSGDRVAGYVPNTPETVIAMLATTSIGAIWTSCSPDYGAEGLVDRFGQISPKVLIMANGYYYNGKWFDCLGKAEDLLISLHGLEHILVFPYGDEFLTPPNNSRIVHWDTALSSMSNVTTLEFEQVNFNHPLFILYSSGTTGAPKCIVHGTGGTLIQHLKEHQLHCDIKPDDRVFYYATCGWMMWNWHMSALASRATLLLYDGSPAGEILWQYAAEEKMTLFGTSAKYIESTAKSGLSPKEKYDLSSLRMITSTGSPLSPEGFDYIYENVASNICLASISGGTDIISCFLLGNPTGAVWRGELQAPGLGMNVQVVDDGGHPLVGKKGELVCTAAFPSMPVFFWGDEDYHKYHAAYFERIPGVWCQGDYVEKTYHGGYIIYGRSDTVLNPGGVRIGTAEIYRQIEKFPEILESIVVGQDWNNDIRVLLFVKMAEGHNLTPGLAELIKASIRTHTSPRHVPSKIIPVDDIPRTKSGKLVELAVRDVIHNQPIKNVSALENPEALELFRNLPELKE